MILDLVKVKPKINKFKVVMCIIIIFLLLCIPVMFIIKDYMNKKQYNEMEQGNVINNIDNNSETTQDSLNQQSEEIPIVTLTETGIQNIKNIYHSDEKVAYLTFDDGPSKTVTPLILDLLKQEDIKATFFVLGSRVELYPELVRQAYEEGHYIANHGYSHVYQDIYSSIDALLDEYYQTENAIREAIGIEDYNCNLFRFPGGSNGGKYDSFKSEAKVVLEEHNIAYVDWNALTNDANGQNLTKEQMYDELVNTTSGKNSVVILMHDAGDKILTYELLPDIIQYLRDEGYTFKNFYSIIQ